MFQEMIFTVNLILNNTKSFSKISQGQRFLNINTEAKLFGSEFIGVLKTVKTVTLKIITKTAEKI